MQQVQNQAAQLKQLQSRLHLSMQRQLETRQHYLLRLADSLQQLNPQNVLARGYAIVSQHEKAVTDSAQLQIGQDVHILLHVGEAQATIKNINIKNKG